MVQNFGSFFNFFSFPNHDLKQNINIFNHKSRPVRENSLYLGMILYFLQNQ